MDNISEFHIIGRIGKASVMDKVAFLDIAANYRRKVEDEWVDDPHWNRVTFFGKNIERVAKMSVGDLVRVTGRFRQSRYERDGKMVYGTDVIAERITVLPKNGAPSDDRDAG